MHTRLRRWLDALPLIDPVERRQARVLQLVLIGWIILAASDNALFFLLPFPIDLQLLAPMARMVLPLLNFAAALLLIGPVSALVALRRGHFNAAVAVASLGLLLATSLATFVFGSTNGIALIVFQIPLALAGLLAGRRLLLTIAGLSLAVVIVVGILQSLSPPLAGFFSMMPSADGSGEASSVVDQQVGIYVGFFVAITGVLTLLLDRFGSALRHALADSLQREAELRSIRASLETIVAERTATLATALHDVQTRAQAQAELLAENEQQRTAIRSLSVPVIPISGDTLVMPLVGALDSARLRQVQEQSLRALERTSARRLVLDVTGVPIVDSQVAQGFLSTVRSARLLGAEVTMVGIRPEVAQAIIGMGIELDDIHSFSDLQAALAPSSTHS
jgi:rsbT co-antagonist protein RsbR